MKRDLPAYCYLLKRGPRPRSGSARRRGADEGTMINAEIWNHVDGDIARWAGCTLPPGWDEYEADLAAMRLTPLDHITEEIPF